MFILSSAKIGATTFSTLATSSWNAGIERAMLAAADNHQAEFELVQRQLARGMFATRDLDTAIVEPVQGAASLHFVQVDQGGTANATWISIAGAQVLAIPRTVNWSAGGAAALAAIELIFLSTDGATAPMVIGSDAGVSTAETDVWVGSGQGISGLAVDYGFQESIPPDGFLYPVNAFIVAQRPSVAVSSVNDSDITTAGLVAGEIAQLDAVFAKIAPGGIRGATRTYSCTGHRHVATVAGAKPGTVQRMVAGSGGVTIS